MRIDDIILAIKKGEAVTDKRILRLLKRKGLIYDFNWYGHLKIQKVYYFTSDGKIALFWTKSGPEIQDGQEGSYYMPFSSLASANEAGYTRELDIEYNGHRFSAKANEDVYLRKVSDAEYGIALMNDDKPYMWFSGPMWGPTFTISPLDEKIVRFKKKDEAKQFADKNLSTFKNRKVIKL